MSKNAAVHEGQSSLYSVSFHRGRPWRLWALRSGKCFKEQHIHPEERCSQLWNPCDVSTSQGKETGSLLLKKAFIKETNVKYKCNLGLGMWIRPWNDPSSYYTSHRNYRAMEVCNNQAASQQRLTARCDPKVTRRIHQQLDVNGLVRGFVSTGILSAWWKPFLQLEAKLLRNCLSS